MARRLKPGSSILCGSRRTAETKYVLRSTGHALPKLTRLQTKKTETKPIEQPTTEPKDTERDEAEAEEPEFDPSDEDESNEELFPTTHELILKDHTKVVSALAMDPSGARIIYGSHDYDCKLWDFGGMDWRCKPFNSWEPAGTYYVSSGSYGFPFKCVDEVCIGA